MSRIFEFATNILNKSNLRFTTRVCGSAILSCFNYNWGIKKKLQVSVADPGFPRRGAIPKREGTTYYFDHFFLKTAYKMKKNGLGCVQMYSCKYDSKETLVICLNLSICFSIWMVVKDFLWLSTSESGWSLEVFYQHQTMYCKYLHRIWMVTKGLSWPFYMLTDAETDADHMWRLGKTQR